MASAASIVVPLLLCLFAAAYLYYAYRVHGWATMRATLLSLPARSRAWLASALRRTRLAVGLWRYDALDSDGTPLQLRRRRVPIPLEHIQFVKYTDPVHRFVVLYPSTWALARTDNPAASIIVQMTCDSGEESYKRFSVAWDDVSWSATTAESFGRNVARQLPALVPGAVLVSHGLYNPAARSDRAYQIVYRIADAVDGSELELLNVVVVAAHGGRRRAYTLTFGADVAAFAASQRLVSRIVDSFRFEESGGSGGGGGVGGGGGARRDGGAAPAPAPSARETFSPSDAGSDDVHVNVWDRADPAAAAAAAAAHGGLGGPRLSSGSLTSAAPPSPAAAAGGTPDEPPAETPAAPERVAWQVDSVPQAALTFQRPARWVSGGTGYDGAPGFAPLASTAVRRCTAAFTCDRREASYKHVSLVCVDLTPCYDLLAARAGAVAARGGDAAAAATPGGGGATAGDRAAALLLAYLAYRYRGEVAATEALSRGAPPPPPPPLSPGDESLRPWLELFAARWPASCRLSSPVAAMVTGGATAAAGAAPPGGAAGAAAPVQCAVADARTVGASLLLKVRGWLRTAAAAPGGVATPSATGGGATPAYTPTPSPMARAGRSSSEGLGTGTGGGGGPQRHYSTYSNLSMENEGLLAEGLLVATTSAVLLGVHEVPAAAADGTGPAPARRVWGHVVTFAASSDAFAAYEPLARHVFHSLETALGP